MWNAPWPHDIKVAGTDYHSSLKTLRTFMVIIIIIDLWGDKGHAWKTILHKFSNVSSTWDHPSCKTLWATRDIFHIANGVPEHINCEPSPKHTQLTLCHPAAWCVQCIPITCQKMRLIRCELQMACICVQGPRDGHSTTLKPTQQRLYIDHLWVRTKIIQYRNLTFRKAQKRAGAFGWAPEYLACATSALGGCIACHMYPRMVWKYLSIGGAGLEVGIKGKCGILCFYQVVHRQGKPALGISMGHDFSMLKMQQSEITRHKWRYLVIYELERLHQKRLAFVAPSSKSTPPPFFLRPTSKALRISAQRFFSFSSLLTTISRAATAHSPAQQHGFSKEDRNRFHTVFSPSWIKASQFSSCQHMSTCVINTTCVAALERKLSVNFHSPKQIYTCNYLQSTYTSSVAVLHDVGSGYIDSRPCLARLDDS